MANDTYERFSAIREGFRNAAEETWFTAMPSLEQDARKAFARGFDAGYKHSPAAALTSPVAPEQVVAIDRESLIDLIEDNLYAVYHCTRVWSAWGVGTMSEDDFHEARGTELAPDLADAIIAKFAASPEAAPAAMEGVQSQLIAFVKKVASGELEDHMLSSLEDEARALYFRAVHP